MPEWILKGGEKPPKDMVDFLAENRENYLRVNMEVESSHERLRRSFHCLLQAVIQSGEHNIEVDGERIITYDDLKNHYKLIGCDGIPLWYRFKKFRTKDKEWLYSAVIKRYGEQYLEFITEDAKSWTKMNKKQKSKCLNALLTDVKYSMTNNQKVLMWVARIEGDLEALREIDFHKNIGE